MADAQNKIKLIGKPILLFQRGDLQSANWHIRIWIRNERRYEQRSSQTEDADEARRIALNLWDEIRFKQIRGIPTRTRPFEQIAESYRAERLAERCNGRLSEGMLHVDQSTIDNWLLPYFRGRPLSSITSSDVRAWQHWRRRYWKSDLGKARKRPHVPEEPSDQTMHAEASVLRGIFVHAVELCELDIQQVPTCKWIPPRSLRGRRGRRRNRRPDIPEGELQKLGAFMPRYRQHNNARIQAERNLLCDFVQFSLATGLRPKEARLLRWEQIKPYVLKDGTPTVVIHVPDLSKTGMRKTVAESDAKRLLEGMRKRPHHTADADYIFCLANGKPRRTFKDGFRRLMEDCGILVDTDGKRRTLYSTRHTYATQRLMEGWPDSHLAANMGTSPEMIHRHYSHIKDVLAADQTMSRLSREGRRGLFLEDGIHEDMELKLAVNAELLTTELTGE